MTEIISQALNSQDEIVFMDSADLVKIEQAASSYMEDHANVIIITIRNTIQDSDELFKAFNSKLKFLSYFGNNWDAFCDVMRDYPGQAEESMNRINTIIVNNISLPQSRATTYMEILLDAKGLNNGCRIVILASNKCRKDIESRVDF